jgi:hypothetical protein
MPGSKVRPLGQGGSTTSARRQWPRKRPCNKSLAPCFSNTAVGVSCDLGDRTARPARFRSLLVDIWSGHHCRVHWGAIGRATRERLHQMKSEPRFVSRSPILLASVSGHRDEERRFHAG